MPDVMSGQLMRLGERMGIHNYREGSSVTLTADCKATKHKKVKWLIWTSIDGKETPVETPTNTHELTFADVPADKEYYMVRYKIEWRGKVRPGPYEFVVWPESIDVAAEMKDDGRKDEDGNAVKQRFQMTVRQEGRGIIAQGLLTDAEGKGEGYIPLAHCGRVAITAVSPWQIDTDDTKFHRKRTLKVSRKPYKAQIYRSHDEGAQKQWVNLPADAQKPDQGHAMEVEVGAVGDKEAASNAKLGLAGDVIFCKVTFDKDNSKRSDPRPGVSVGGAAVASVAPQGSDHVISFKVKLGDDRIGRFTVECGQAGGDKIKVQVGVTDACGDDTMDLVTWRVIGINLAVPDEAIRMPSDLLDADGFAAPLKGQLKRIMDQLFIEVRVATVKVFTLGDLIAYYGPLANGHVVIPKAYFPHITTAGEKVLILNENSIKDFMNSVLAGVSRPDNTFNAIFCDRMADTGGFTPKGVNANLSADSPTHTVEVDANLKPYYQFFKYHPGSFTAVANNPNRTYGVLELSWRALEFKEGGTWKPLANGKPGWAKRAWTDLVISGEVIDEYVTFESASKVIIKLPAGGEADTLMRSGDGVKIQVWAKLIWPDTGTNGFAQGGTAFIAMTTGWGAAKPKGMARTLTHEIGHNLGHAYFELKGTRQRGRPAGKKIPGIEFGAYVTDNPKGHYYCNNFGHVGGHCCYMPNKPELQECENFSRPTANDKTRFGDDVATQLDQNKGCIIFGAGDMANNVKEFSYCPDCNKYLKATNCSDVLNYKA